MVAFGMRCQLHVLTLEYNECAPPLLVSVHRTSRSQYQRWALLSIVGTTSGQF